MTVGDGAAPGPELEIGVGFWSMQSTYMRPRPPAYLYREAAAEARRAEELGFDAMWIGEHHLSYDGYCPSLLPAAATFLSATTRIMVGTGVLVLPFHPAARVAEGCAALQSLAPGRLRTAMGIGYRDVEFAAAGLEVRQRARLTDERLAELLRSPLRERFGDTELWFGTGNEAGVARAARHGASVLLQPAIGRRRIPELRARWDEARPPLTAGARPPRFGVLREVWLEDDPRRLEWIRARLYEMWRHYSNFWVTDPLSEQERREVLAEQMSRTALFGSPAEVTDRLGALIEAGVDTLALRVRFDGVSGPALERCLERLAGEVLPHLRKAA
jgi:alkanesulfonate monooxygenase SsuD/methylene tetrahydromethanopterin reductase-like flavin-dependent oxidoreductase (luciferase family)